MNSERLPEKIEKKLEYGMNPGRNLKMNIYLTDRKREESS